METIVYKTYQTPSDFLKLQQGENIIRIVSNGGMATIFGMRSGTKWIRFGEKVPDKTLADSKEKGYEIKGVRRWIWVAINRTYQTIGIMEVGVTIGDTICNLAKDQGIDPQEVDLIITRTGIGKNTKYDIKLSPASQPLTEAEQKLIVKNKESLIKKRYGT